MTGVAMAITAFGAARRSLRRGANFRGLAWIVFGGAIGWLSHGLVTASSQMEAASQKYDSLAEAVWAEAATVPSGSALEAAIRHGIGIEMERAAWISSQPFEPSNLTQIAAFAEPEFLSHSFASVIAEAKRSAFERGAVRFVPIRGSRLSTIPPTREFVILHGVYDGVHRTYFRIDKEQSPEAFTVAVEICALMSLPAFKAAMK